MTILPPTLEEARRRDAILRNYVENRNWGLDREQTLVRELVLASAEKLPGYALLVGLEWDADGEGRGDLLFVSECLGRAAVVEVKRLPPRSRNNARNTVEKQARRYGDVLERVHPTTDVARLVYTCDESQARLGPREEAARVRW